MINLSKLILIAILVFFETSFAQSQTTEDLFHAVRDSNLLEVQKILSGDINAIINLQDDRGYTALMEAVSIGNFEIVKYLLEKGADVQIISFDYEETTALDLAVLYQDYKICEILFKYGAHERFEYNEFRKSYLDPVYFQSRSSAIISNLDTVNKLKVLEFTELLF